jgi:Cys-tRNA(Pro)/Cys-tRNA(Cys) deacylase
MTPAIKHLHNQKVLHSVHQYIHDTNCTSFGEEAVEKLAVTANQVFKTLVVLLSSEQLCVAVLPVNKHLSTKRIASAMKTKQASMADIILVERVTGYSIGAVSPIAQKKRLPTIIDQSAINFAKIFVSGGRRGLEVALAPDDLAVLCDAKFAHICQT